MVVALSPAIAPIITLRLPSVRSFATLFPMATLSPEAPTFKFSRASDPIAMLFPLLSSYFKALKPMAILLPPSVIAVPASSPSKTLKLPPFSASPAFTPSLRLDVPPVIVERLPTF